MKFNVNDWLKYGAVVTAISVLFAIVLGGFGSFSVMGAAIGVASVIAARYVYDYLKFLHKSRLSVRFWAVFISMAAMVILASVFALGSFFWISGSDVATYEVVPAAVMGFVMPDAAGAIVLSTGVLFLLAMAVVYVDARITVWLASKVYKLLKWRLPV